LVGWQSFFFCGLFWWFYQYLGCIASSGKIIDEWWTGKDFDRNNRALIEVLPHYLPGVVDENFSQDGQYPSQGLDWALPGALLLHQPPQ
jgi:hypothetical protein